jgi:hypothetical protein
VSASEENRRDGEGVIAFVIAAVIVSAAAGQSSGPPGQWTRITATNGRNTDEVGLARTGDGVLHVAWLRRETGSKEGIWHHSIAADGTVPGSSNAIATDWASANFPDLIRTAGGGLRVFFGGIRTTSPGEPQTALNTATAPASGASWALQPGSVSRSTVTYATTVGAAPAKDGTPVVAWEDGSPGSNGYHFGVNRSGPEAGYERSGCCVYKADVGVDASSGNLVVAWYSNITGKSGIYTRELFASGPGTERYVPTSATSDRRNALSLSQRVGITGRLGAPGVYVGFGSGYPTYQSVKLWRVGDSTPLLSIGRVARGSSTSQPARRVASG